MIFLLILFNFAPSAYFTIGNGLYPNYTLSGYISFINQDRYIFLGYERYYEENFRQNLISIGLGRSLINRLYLRTILIGYQNNLENRGLVFTTRTYYGINPWYSLGCFYTLYSQNIPSGQRFYWIAHLNPEVNYIINKLRFLPCFTFGLVYTKNLDGDYFVGVGKVKVNVISPLFLEVGGFYGQTYHFIDDQSVLVCNRLNLQKAKFNIKLEYVLFNKLHLIGAITKNVFSRYNINYGTFGISYQSK
ncbi:MAG: hypothetical protein NZ601_02965 [candidate division WOR-3 bacterium]|nr:hypothetical protein [candidate division WOR-3 bacterium]MCX7756944.1 hypothetical protein [candidate division WOR-3 bacterium]MDW7987716.1 hypothetical protein [candidate division WOR-3 bacterium]